MNAFAGMLSLLVVVASQSTCFSQENLTVIPNVTGMNRTAAVDTLRRAGFRVQIGLDASCAFPQGTIFKQQPVGNSTSNRGAVVIILENTTGGFKMPNLTGLAYEEAKAKADTLGMSSTLDQRAERFRTDIDGTCETPSETYTAVESQYPLGGTDICVQNPGSVHFTRTKLKQKKKSPRYCDPVDRRPRNPWAY